MNVIDSIFTLFREKAQGAYFGENVSEMEHSLQCAHLAERAGSDSPLICAALLHDIGHLLHGLPEDIAERGVDGTHESCGAVWLARNFGPEVVDPVRLHVSAKRYLCVVEPEYLEALSDSSRRSLMLQGGPMSSEETERFEHEPGFRDAIALRRWDDTAKVPTLTVPGLEHYRRHLETAILPQERT